VTGLTEEKKKLNLSRKVPIKHEGCGREMAWKDMEDVIDEVLQNLKKIEDTDYYSNIDDNLKFVK
jgi:hypothetical protein